jgi:hypothetical protein
VLLLCGCLVVLGAAGAMAGMALRSTSAPTQVLSGTVVVDSNDPGGTAKLTVLDDLPLANSSQGVPAGTQFVTTNATLAEVLVPPAGSTVGTTLTCDLRVRIAKGTPVIDVVRCAAAPTSPRG